LVNADFYQGWSVVIEKYPDKIVMANPGTIITGKQQMLKGGISQPRNKGLFKMFNLIGLGEHAGSGVPDIFKAWSDAGLDEPVVEEKFGSGNPDRTILTLPLLSREESLAISGKQPEKSPEKSPKTTRAEQIERRVELVLELIMSNPSLSRAEIARTLKITDSQARTAIEKLKERKAIHREGSDTDGKWIVD
jgi:predicted HTH transcriptional regulator